MKLKLLTLSVYLWLVILSFSGCQTNEPLTVPSEDMFPILQTNYYLRLPAGYQFTPFWGDSGQSGNTVVLLSINYPGTHPEIWIWPATFGIQAHSSSTRSIYDSKPEYFDGDFLPPEKISSDPLSIYLAKYAFEEDQVSQLLAQGQVGPNMDGEVEGLVILVYGAFSQQEEGYLVAKELLRSITYIAPTPEP